jgi:hypothetical protein
LASQSINTFTPDPSSPVVGGSYNIAGTASSGLPVTFSVPSLTVCTLNGNTVSFIAVGTCQVIFLQQGNSQFNAATQVLRSFAIGRGTQTISFTSSMNGASVGGFANLLAVSSAGFFLLFFYFFFFKKKKKNRFASHLFKRDGSL